MPAAIITVDVVFFEQLFGAGNVKGEVGIGRACLDVKE
jgi:hypothetical protein